MVLKNVVGYRNTLDKGVKETDACTKMARQVYLSIPHRSSFEFRRSKGALGRETRVPWTWANCWMSLTLRLVRSRIRQWSAQMHYLEERHLAAQKPFLFESCKRWQYGSTQRLLWGEWKSPGEENDMKWQPWHHRTERWNIFQQNQTNPRLFTVNTKFFTSLISISQISLKPFHKEKFSQILSFWQTYMYMHTWMALHNISPAIYFHKLRPFAKFADISQGRKIVRLQYLSTPTCQIMSFFIILWIQ